MVCRVSRRRISPGISLEGRAEGATRQIAAVKAAKYGIRTPCPMRESCVAYGLNWQQAAANSIWARIEPFVVVDHVRRLSDPGQLCGELR